MVKKYLQMTNALAYLAAGTTVGSKRFMSLATDFFSEPDLFFENFHLGLFLPVQSYRTFWV
jgi:hypothetical protein